MLQPTSRIYFTANLLVYLFFALFLFPEGLGFGFVALFFSVLFSAPTIPLLMGCFYLIRRCRPGLTGSWVLLLFTVGAAAFLPLIAFTILVGSLAGDHIFFLFSFGSAFGSVLLQSFYIARYFKTLHYENEEFSSSN